MFGPLNKLDEKDQRIVDALANDISKTMINYAKELQNKNDNATFLVAAAMLKAFLYGPFYSIFLEGTPEEKNEKIKLILLFMMDVINAN